MGSSEPPIGWSFSFEFGYQQFHSHFLGGDVRHVSETVTDGYSHARLAELAECIAQLPSPINKPAMSAKYKKIVNGGALYLSDIEKRRWKNVGKENRLAMHNDAQPCANDTIGTLAGNEIGTTVRSDSANELCAVMRGGARAAMVSHWQIIIYGRVPKWGTGNRKIP